MSFAELFNCFNSLVRKALAFPNHIAILSILTVQIQCTSKGTLNNSRERISLNENWKFYKYKSGAEADDLIYDVRPEVKGERNLPPAVEKPAETEEAEISRQVLKPWILPTGNNFIKRRANRHIRPKGNPGSDFPFVKADFDDSSWDEVNLPHDWAIAGPFYEGWDAEVGGSMGRLPCQGVAWYRKKLDIPLSDKGKCIFLDVEGAMSYAIVWMNGNLVGGWPYGYTSWRVDLTPYIVPGGKNQLAIRLDNPNNSSRWYPGGGIYRNVWLTKTHPVHIGQWGTLVITRNVSNTSATIDLEVTIDNDSGNDVNVKSETQFFILGSDDKKTGSSVANIRTPVNPVAAGENITVKGSVVIDDPLLWGPPPGQLPHRYIAITTLWQENKPIDRYETRFGIRSLRRS